MNCPNCNTRLSCGCQKRVAKDGSQVCSSCISSYTRKITQTVNPSNIAPEITNIKLQK